MSWPLTGLVARKVIGSPVRRLVLLTMASRANDDGTGIFASFSSMARDCELSRATVKRTVKEFESEGLVKQVGTRACLNGETNDYTIQVCAVETLTDIERTPVQREPGAARTRPKEKNGVHAEPGFPREPGSERPQTRVTVTPKPIQEPLVVDVAAARAREADLWHDRLVEAKARAEGACNLTNGNIHHVADLKRLVQVEGCDWHEDVLPAIDRLSASFKAKGRLFHGWKIVSEAACENRDTRLRPPTPPGAVLERPRGAKSNESTVSTIQRMIDEGRV